MPDARLDHLEAGWTRRVGGKSPARELEDRSLAWLGEA